MFKFEALQAKHGDSLVIQYGDEGSPQILVVDGGPGGGYRRYLKKRLLELKSAFSPTSPLSLPLVMVSHMDDDHVNGILDLFEELQESHSENEEGNFEVEQVWFNSFDDIVGNDQIPEVSALSASATVADLTDAVPELRGGDGHINAVIASTGQGRRLRDDVSLLGVSRNEPFNADDDMKLVRGGSENSEVTLDGGLKITVLHPQEKRLCDMQAKWDRDLREAEADGDNSVIFASFGDRDTSPFNLASIVCMLEYEGKKILLTGDARDDDILKGLSQAGFLDGNGEILVDVLKVPHHGSDRNVSTEFFTKVKAKNYVISGNGRHHNPDRATLVMLSMATRGTEDFTIHFTNSEGSHDLKEVLDEFIEDDRARGRTYGFEFRDEEALSLEIDFS